MGFIKRHQFWCDHHYLYVEPTKEQKILERRKSNTMTAKLGFLAMTAMLMQSKR